MCINLHLLAFLSFPFHLSLTSFSVGRCFDVNLFLLLVLSLEILPKVFQVSRTYYLGPRHSALAKTENHGPYIKCTGFSYAIRSSFTIILSLQKARFANFSSNNR